MKKLRVLIIVFISMPFLFVQGAESNTQDTNSKSYSLYLIRHAEKQIDKDDPTLTQCGKFRAKQLASILENAKIKKIYSTRFKRTMATASPLALQQKLAINSYAPNKLEQLAWQLIKEKDNAVVFGHSNTTPQLAELLSQTKVESISEKQYRGIYQVVISGKNRHLNLLMQPLICK
ncbi:MAG: histidine phosphatase family protein [Colwellia sp.]|nr:histidine phosphatase family protein [Colwellia sp.]